MFLQRVINHQCTQCQEIVDPNDLFYYRWPDSWPVCGLIVSSKKEEIYTVNHVWYCR